MKKEQDYILLIMNCQKYRYKLLHQKNTWLKSLTSKLIYYHVIGNDLLETDFIFDDDERILWVKTGDDYNSLPKKVISAYHAINESFSYKYIFKTDDDQNLVNDKFFDTIINILSVRTPPIHYGGHIVDVPFAYLSQYHRVHSELPKYLPVYPTKYCSGRFYFLSQLAVIDLILRKNKIYQEYLEDYAIGLNLYEQLKLNILDIKTDKYFKDYPDYPENPENQENQEI
jgi:hypothetical protein